MDSRFQYFIFAGVMALLGVLITPMLVEEVASDELTVIQAPITGKLSWYTTPQWAWQGFGTVTTYKRIYVNDFYANGVNDKTGKPTGGIEIRFSDGGHATMFGTVSFRMPEDETALNRIHANFKGSTSVRSGLLESVLNKSVYLSGTLMTSKESYAEKKNDLIHYVSDQMQNGVYRTQQKTTWIKDEITQQSKQVTLADIMMNKEGLPERQEDSVLNQYKITAFNFTIKTMPYDDTIEKQITQQQSIQMSVQTSIAEAKQADQRALTAEAEGRANAAKAKWEQETIKAREVTKAEQEKLVALTQAEKERQVAETQGNQRLTVADLDRRSAEQNKLKNILDGEGEAAKRKLVLEADGALAQKLEAYTNTQRAWADAFSRHTGDVVPRIVMGSGGTVGAAGGPSNAVQTFMDLQTMKAAKDLGLDMDMRTMNPTQKK